MLFLVHSAAVSWSGGAMSGLGLVPAGLACAAAWVPWPASLWVPAGVLFLLCCTLSSTCCSEKHLSNYFSHSTISISSANIMGGFDWTRSSGLTSRSTVVKAEGGILSEEAENIRAPQVIQKTTRSQGPGINSFNIKPGPCLRQYLHQDSNNYGLHLPKMRLSTT